MGRPDFGGRRPRGEALGPPKREKRFTGLGIELAGTAAGTVFGNGSYFAESSSKSDHYAKNREKDWGGHTPAKYRTKGVLYDDLLAQEERYATLLCRVTLGESYRQTSPDSEAERYVLGNPDFRNPPHFGGMEGR